MIQETDKAYIAGIVDGEGHVTIHRNASKKSMETLQRKTPMYCPWVSVCNTNVEVLRFIQENYGGSLHLSPNKRRIPVWNLVLTFRAAQRLLTDIVPYMRMKKSIAEVVLAFYENAETNDKVGVTREEIERRESLFQQARALNPLSRPQRLTEVPPVA